MADLKEKVDEIREKEATTRKGILAKIRSVDQTVYVGVIIAVIIVAVVVGIAVARS